MDSSAKYVIPATLLTNQSGKAFLLIPLFALTGAAIGFLLSGTFEGALTLGGAGFAVAIPLTIVSALVIGLTSLRRYRATWKKHSFSWYRQTFPANAHPNGHVSCRHCGSHKVHVTKLMNGTYTRLHACQQCGETLYFSPESV